MTDRSRAAGPPAASPSARTAEAGWFPLVILCAARFVMVLDSSVMNVSLTQIVADLDTTIQGVQLAITAHTLVMAAFVLVGAKLGDIWDATAPSRWACSSTGSGRSRRR